mgnify:CR=1 FL=1
MSANRERIQLVFIIILAITCIALIIALAVVASKTSKTSKTGLKSQSEENKLPENGFCSETPKVSDPKPPRSKGLFDDLSEEEINAVKKYMINQKELNIVPFKEAKVNTNYIYLIEFRSPLKQEALSYLDGNGSKPDRKARVVVYMGAMDPPVVQEYLVYPAAEPKNHEKRLLGKNFTIPFHTRVGDAHEMEIVDQAMINLTKTLQKLLNESYDGYIYDGCKEKCLTYATSGPLGRESGERKHWVFFQRNHPGAYIQDIAFQVLYNTLGNDVTQWHVEKIFYNNQTFKTAEELLHKYNNGSIAKKFVPAPNTKPLYSSLNRRGSPQPERPLRPPQIFEPDGKRYTVSGRHIEYMGWSFDFRLRTSSGIQIFDVKFKEERIIYELSLQEAVAFYSGYTPKGMNTNYWDSYWGTGYYKLELVPGIDCPHTSTLFDAIHSVNRDRPMKIRNAICVFELTNGIPFRRHYNINYKGGYNFYGGMPSSALVLRTVTTAYNYDYVFDYIFYPNGVVEVRVGATGYLQAGYWTNNELPYGYKVHNVTAGLVHDHIINYKVDLDVAGQSNYYQTIDVEIENITDQWSPGRRRVQKVLRRRTKDNEKDALYRYNFEKPRYLNFFSETARNRNGVERGYRIHLKDVTKMSYPETWPLVNGAAWSLHQLVVTKRKESEDRSSCIYNQADPYSPVVKFKEFYEDNDSIRNEDLVAWVTTGSLHIPHSEDIPNTATVSNTFGFFIRPFNYFDEDPSIASTDGVFIRPTDDKYSGTKIENYGKSSSECTPKQKSINFRGSW